MRIHDSKIHRIMMDDPGDVSGLEKAIDDGEIDPLDIQCVMISHEGGLFSKAYTSMAFAVMLARKTGKDLQEIERTVPFQGIAGMSGYMVPHVAVFVRRDFEGEPLGEKRLAIAGGCTRELLPEEIGTMAHVEEVSKRTRELVTEAGIDDPSDVQFVFVKGQWAKLNDKEAARARGAELVADDWWTLGSFGRAAAALGAGHGIGEIRDDQLLNATLLEDQDKLYTSIAHVSAGEERPSNAIVVLGNSSRSVSDSVVGRGVLKDGLDSSGMKDILRSIGFEFECCPSETDLERVEYAFIKPKANELPTIRGHRHTLVSDLILGPHWWIVEKAPMHGLASDVLGTTVMEIATGSEHQGPPGQPLMAIVAKAN